MTVGWGTRIWVSIQRPQSTIRRVCNCVLAGDTRGHDGVIHQARGSSRGNVACGLAIRSTERGERCRERVVLRREDVDRGNCTASYSSARLFNCCGTCGKQLGKADCDQNPDDRYNYEQLQNREAFLIPRLLILHCFPPIRFEQHPASLAETF